MKLIDKFDPKLPKDLQKRYLISTFLQTSEFPTIEMTFHQKKDVEYTVQATVKFNFKNFKKYVSEYELPKKIINKDYTRIIAGPSEDVYKLAAKQASRISLSLGGKFNDAWQKTLMQLLNKPSKNKSILNLGVYQNKKESFGIYDITSPSVLLQKQLTKSGITQQVLAALSKVDEVTLWRHLKGTYEISREAAIKYAKALGCDPVEILFNALNIPVWGSTNTQDQSMLNKFSVYASEITATKEIDNVRVPREIYRPDVKAIVIDCPNSAYHGHTAFYYNSNAPIVFEDQMVIVGTKIPNFHGGELRMRYFIGIYKKNKNGKTIDLHTIDADAVDVGDLEPDEDMRRFEEIVGYAQELKFVIDDITPEFVAPIVALVNNSKINDPIKTEVLKGYDKIYTENRKEDFKSKENFNKLKHSYISKEEAKDIGVIGAELIKQMELNKKNQKAIDEAIQKIQDAEEPNITPEEAAK